MKIEPTSITDYNRSEADLQKFWTFCVLVAGKNADWASHKVGQLYSYADAQGITPFEYLRQNEHSLHNLLVSNRVGQYGRIEAALRDSMKLDLRTCSVDDLEDCFGVGPKTARFFLLHSRPGIEVAVLDTHILRWLRQTLGDDGPWPSSTPSQPAYGRIERVCINLMRSSFPGSTLAQADLLVWCLMSGRLEGEAFPKPKLPGIPIGAVEVD